MKHLLLPLCLLFSTIAYGMDYESDSESESEENDKKYYDITELFPLIEQSLKDNLTYTNSHDTTDLLAKKLNEKDQSDSFLFSVPQVKSVLSEQLQPMIQVTFTKNKTAENIDFKEVIKPLFEKSSCNDLAIKYGFGKKDYYEDDTKIVFSFFKKFSQKGLVLVGDQSNFISTQGNNLLERLAKVKEAFVNKYNDTQKTLPAFVEFEKSHLCNRSSVFLEATEEKAKFEIGYTWEKFGSFVGTSLKRAVEKMISTEKFECADFEFKNEVEENKKSLVIKALLVKDLLPKSINS